MPTIKQLPAATSVSATDVLPVSQGGTTRSLSIGGLLSSTQSAIALSSGKLLGRASVTAGGPEPISVGSGLAVAGGVVSATADDHTRLQLAPGLSAADELVVNAAGAPRRVPAASVRGLFTAGAGVAIDAAGTISASGAGALATASTAGAVKPGTGLTLAGDGTLSADGSFIANQVLASPVVPSRASANPPVGMGVSFLYEQSALPIAYEGLGWANSPYAYFAVCRDFGPELGGNPYGPVVAMFALANNTGSPSDVVAVLGDAVARTSGGTVFGGNLVARTDGGIAAKLVGLEIDLEPAITGPALPGSIALAINAYSHDMPAPAIQLGGLGGGTFENGVIIAAVRFAGLCAQNGSTMGALVDARGSTYTDAALVLDSQQRIRFQGSGPGSAYLGTDASRRLAVIPPENGFVIRDPSDTANLALFTAAGAAFTGPASFSATPIAPTASPADNSTKLATTAFVQYAAAHPPAATTAAIGAVKPDGATLQVAGDGTISVVSAPGATLVVGATYAASGAIAPGDGLALVNSASACAMTLGAGSGNGQRLVVKRYGSGPVTLSLTLDGAVAAVVTMNSAVVRESVSLTWSVPLSTWLAV